MTQNKKEKITKNEKLLSVFLTKNVGFPEANMITAAHVPQW